MKKHFRPSAWPNHTVQRTAPSYQGTCRSWWLGARPQISEYRRLAYFGRMTSTALPLISSSRLRPDTTSLRPPALAAGAHSDATMTTYTLTLRIARGPVPECPTYA